MLNIKERELIINLYNKGKKQEEISELIGCSQPTVHRWIKYNLSGRTLETLPRSGRPTKLTQQNLIRLKNKILTKIKKANDGYCSVNTKEIGEIIHQEIGKLYSLRHVERIMHKIGFSLIMPRPQHLKHDQEKVDKFRDEFKKNSNRNMWVMK
ncbi:transposase [Candidatus Woesearchaeota archaeon]|nr:transposase [Candidatus Woesearchaeota archaeon]